MTVQEMRKRLIPKKNTLSSSQDAYQHPILSKSKTRLLTAFLFCAMKAYEAKEIIISIKNLSISKAIIYPLPSWLAKRL